MIRRNDVEKLYECYVRHRAGDKTALAEVFCEGRYYTKDGNERLEVGFAFKCLNYMLNKAKREYGLNGKFTGRINGDKLEGCGYMKYHETPYDISAIEEIMREVVIEMFKCPLKDNRPVIDGRTSTVAIVDGITLLKNIKWHLTYRVNQENEDVDLLISEVGYDANQEEAFSYYDIYAAQQWERDRADEERKLFFCKNDIKESRLEIYEDLLYWLQKNDIHQLFNSNAYTKNAIIDTLMDCTYDTFIDNNIGGKSLQQQNMLIDLIKLKTGIKVQQTNLSNDFKYIEEKLLDHTFYSLSYNIGKADKSQGEYFKESDRCLRELPEKSYIKLFDRESFYIYKICDLYLTDKLDDEFFLMIMEEKQDVVFPIILKVRGQRKYDMANAIMGYWDVVSGEKQDVLTDIAETLRNHYQHKENEKIAEVFNGYVMICGVKRKEECFWEVDFTLDKLTIRLRSDVAVKNPVRKTILRSDLKVYEGYTNYYICDTNAQICYKLQKEKRIITKSNKVHQVSVRKIA